MKHVVSADRVPHLWANKAQDNARNSNNNLFFDGDTIYSYGRHFPIARHAEHCGKAFVLFTNDSYSVTTAKHISMVRRAIPSSLPVIETSRVTDSLTSKSIGLILDAIAADFGLEVKRALNSRSYSEHYIDRACAIAEHYREACALFGRTRKPLVIDTVDADKLAVKKEAQRAKQAIKTELQEAKWKLYQEQRAEQDRIDALEFSEKLAAWRNGASVRFNHYAAGAVDYMRIKDEMVQTSRDAVVPIDHVKRIAPLILSLIEDGKTYQRNGHSIHLGEYVIESLDAEGLLTVGCHRFDKAEVLRIAAEINKI
jgi:hypothetical protein